MSIEAWIRQWTKNLNSSPHYNNQNNPFCRLTLLLEMIGEIVCTTKSRLNESPQTLQDNERGNQNWLAFVCWKNVYWTTS